ncbi:MAG: DoxX family membrane protein [Ktedonobacteraceae bacterium]|nr:DoxX family membrane protein [Ktedonobacteraceae bacterium]
MALQTISSKTHVVLTNRQRSIGILRMAFGVAWVFAAYLKWQPAFLSGFADTVKGAMEGQPQFVQVWIGFWLNIIHLNPTFFAVLEATAETLLAVCFLLGLYTDVACVLGILLSLGIWSVGEGFGGPYVAGQSTDVGAAFPYIILCALFFCVRAGSYYSLDNVLASRLKRLPASEKAGETEVEEKVPSLVGERKMNARR